MLPIALIDRVEAAIAGIARTQPPPANATDQQALQQTKALSGRSGEYFAVRSVGRQADLSLWRRTGRDPGRGSGSVPDSSPWTSPCSLDCIGARCSPD